jgi:hypothetical protein
MSTTTVGDVKSLMKQMGRKPIAFSPAYAEIADSVTAGLFLSQAMYWTSTLDDDRDGWFYKTQSECEAETHLSRREQETARKKLKALTWNGEPLLEEKLQGLPAQLHFRVNLVVLARLIAAIKNGGTSQTGSHESATPDRTNPPSIKKNAESTPENTAENPPTPQGGKGVEDPEGFDEFWKSYPRKEEKPTTIRAYRRQVKTDKDRAALLIGLDRWLTSTDWIKDNGQYIPYPATFLNKRKWEDTPRNLPITNGNGGNADFVHNLLREIAEEERSAR